MRCSGNLFCSTLDAKTKRDICPYCTKILLKAGSSLRYDALSSTTTIILSGILRFSAGIEEDSYESALSSPVYGLGLPGRLLSTERINAATSDHGVGETSVTAITDCTLGQVSHETWRAAAAKHPDLSWCLIDAACTIVFDSSRLSSILRTKNAYVATLRLVKLLLDHDAYLTHAQIAEVLFLSKVSVSRAMASIKESHPLLWEKYMARRLTQRPENPRAIT